jgi:hypothetical protein
METVRRDADEGAGRTLLGALGGLTSRRRAVWVSAWAALAAALIINRPRGWEGRDA